MHTAILIGWVVLTAVGQGVARESRIPAVAVLVDSEAKLDTAGLVSILETKLSQEGQARLLERGHVNRLLAEQQLSAAGLVERDSIVKAGKLLRAEAFVLLSIEDGPGQTEQAKGKLVRVRVAETAHGLRLWEGYEALEASQVEAAAERIAERVRAAIRKTSQVSGPVIPVGIVDIHRVQLPEKYEPLARVLPGLLSARLGKEPRIIMLEREDLGTLLREKQLTEGPESAFWKSAVLIDGYLQPNADRGIEMSLRLRKASGEELPSLRVPVDPNGLSGGVEEAVTHVLKAVLDKSPAGRWDPAQEADEFYDQGLLLLVHARRSAARPCFEAAHALQPDNVKYTAALFYVLLPLRRTLSQSGGSGDTPACMELELAELASLLTRQLRAAYESGLLPTRDTQPEFAGIALRSYFGQAISVATEEVRLINHRSRRIWFETAEKMLMDTAAQVGDPVMAVKGRVQLAWACSDDPEEVMSAVRERLNRAILPPEMGGAFASNDSRCFCCEQELRMARQLDFGRLEETNLSGCTERFTVLWNAYVKELAESRDPMVGFFACAAQTLSLEYDRKEENRRLAASYCRRAVDVLLNELHSPNEPLGDSQKRRLRRTMTMCLQMVSWPDANEAAGLWERIYAPLIESGDAHNLALWEVGREPGPYGRPEALERYRRLLVQIDQVYAKSEQSPDINRARAVLRDGLRQMVQLGDSPVPSPDAHGPSVTMLLRRSDWPREESVVRRDPQFGSGSEWVHTAIHEDTLWIGWFFLRSSLPRPFSMAVVSVDLSRRKPGSIWWIALPSPNPLTGFVVRPDGVYMAVPEIGIVVVARGDSDVREIVWKPEVLTEADGLPSRGMMSVADAGNRLWVAYGSRPSNASERESGLGLYDPTDGTWERIFCSSQRGDPPFSAGRPYHIGRLTPAGGKLFFFVDGTRFFPGTTSVDGLCRMDVNTRDLKYFGFGGIEHTGHVVSDRRPWLFAGPSSLVDFDPDTERTRLICGEPWWLKQQPELSIKRMAFERAGATEGDLSRKLTYGPSGFGYVDLSGAAIHENRIWARLGGSQIVIIPMSGAEGEAITLDNNLLDGGGVIRFVSTPQGLIGIGNGTAGIIDTRTWSGSGR
jgi:hypothetical protein